MITTPWIVAGNKGLCSHEINTSRLAPYYMLDIITPSDGGCVVPN